MICCEVSTTAGFLSPLLGRMRNTACRCCYAALGVLTISSMPSNADDRRWRVFEQADGAILAVSGTVEASDDLGSPFFRCQKKSDRIEVQGTANQDLRNTMADLIRSGGYPSISLLPEGPLNSTVLDLSYSEMGGDWDYKFDLQANVPAIHEFRRTGRLEFKLGPTLVREEFKIGVESIGRFIDLCKRPPK